MYNFKAVKIEIKNFIYKHVIGLHYIQNQNKSEDVLIFSSDLDTIINHTYLHIL